MALINYVNYNTAKVNTIWSSFSCSNINLLITIFQLARCCLLLELLEIFQTKIFFRIMMAPLCPSPTSKYLVRSLKREMTQTILTETTQILIV